MLASLSRSLRKLVTKQTFLLALGAWCLSQSGILYLHNSFRQLTDESILDLRPEGYSEADVRQLLHTAGAQGRQLYTWISLLDLGVYMWSYTFLLSGLLTMASAVAPFEFFKFLNLLPVVAVLFDVVENSLTLSMLLTYPGLVDTMAPLLPAVSRWKWTCLYCCACLVAGTGCYCLAVAAGLAGKRGGSRRGQAAGAGSSGKQDKAQRQQQKQPGRAKRA